MSQRMRSYEVAHSANPGKEAALVALLPWWQRGLVHVQMIQVRQMKAGHRIGFLDTKDLPPYLAQRQWKSVVNQVNAGLRSWQERAVVKMRPIIAALDVDDERRKHLFTLSKSGRWWEDDDLTSLISALARTSHPFPNFSRCRTMLMDGPIAQIEESKSPRFSRWVRFTMQTGSKPVRIPLTSNPYMDAQPGDVRRFTQVIVREDETIRVRLVKSSVLAPERTEGRILGLDWGLANLLTTSDGRRYGQALYAWLRARDGEITDLAASLQRQGIRLRDSRRYRRLNARVRAYVKNEVGRILNRIGDESVRGLVVESLDFRGGGLSPRLRRIVSRAGRAILRQRLEALTEDQGIAVTRVHAPYSSQECSGCGFASRSNRISQSGFRCQFCGKTLHADVNAGRVIEGRRSSLQASRPMSKPQVLAHLDQQFSIRWGVPADRVRERHSRPLSRAPIGLYADGQLVE
mgnify:CR=1 FL=1